MKKKFRRSKDDKLVAGVMGGIASYYSWDPTIVRIVWLIFLGFTGFIPGIVAYIIAIFMVPLEGRGKNYGGKK